MLKPSLDKIVVKAHKEEEKTSSGLYIPTEAREVPQQGEVVAVGPGRHAELTGVLMVPGVKVGDTVLFPKYGGDTFTDEGEEYLIMREGDIYGVV